MEKDIDIERLEQDAIGCLQDVIRLIQDEEYQFALDMMDTIRRMILTLTFNEQATTRSIDKTRIRIRTCLRDAVQRRSGEEDRDSGPDTIESPCSGGEDIWEEDD